MEKNDKYVWIAIIIIAIAALAVIYGETYGFGNGGPANLKLSASLNSTPISIYPYQSVFVPVNVSNVGSSNVRSVGVGIFVNNNLTSIYNVSLPSHESVFINFSKQLVTPGTYNVSFVADPSNLYGLVNRSAARVNFQIIVQEPAAPAAYTTLPANWSGEQSTYMDNAGYLTYSYFTGNYGLQSFAISQIPAADAFFYPLLNLTYSYIGNLYSASATYPNASAYSLWIQGSLEGNITAVWAKGLKLNTTYSMLKGTQVSVTQLTHNTTVCGWYSQGWVQTLTYEGNQSCITALARAPGMQTPASQGFIPAVNGSKTVANSTGTSIFGPEYGRLSFMNTSIIYLGAQPNSAPSYSCYGEIASVGNRSYCTTYLFDRTGKIGSLSLIRTSVFLGQENLSAFALINTTLVPEQTAINIGLLSQMNASGASQVFTPGLNNTCGLNFSLSCRSPVLDNGNITMQLYNKINETFVLHSISCYQAGTQAFAPLNLSIPASASQNVSSTCYDNGKAITGVPLGLTLKLGINYTLGTSNTMYHAAGTAYIV